MSHAWLILTAISLGVQQRSELAASAENSEPSNLRGHIDSIEVAEVHLLCSDSAAGAQHKSERQLNRHPPELRYDPPWFQAHLCIGVG